MRPLLRRARLPEPDRLMTIYSQDALQKVIEEVNKLRRLYVI